MRSSFTRYFALSSALGLVLAALVAGQENKERKLDDVILINTDLVVLRAAVTDKHGQAILGLKKENFKVLEDGVEQSIELFSSDSAPVSWGLVLDRSGSMEDMIGDVYRASLHVIDNGTQEDEMFISTFNERVEMVTSFQSDRHKLENSVLGLRAYGTTALYDAITAALDQFKNAKYRKKVLVVVTDGEDNASLTNFRKLIERAEEEEVIVYPVGMFEPGMLMGKKGTGVRYELEKLAEVTGGRAHFPDGVDQCESAMAQISLEVSQQYSLGYYPAKISHDGRWRAISLEVRADKAQKYAVTVRRGYYARKSAN